MRVRFWLITFFFIGWSLLAFGKVAWAHQTIPAGAYVLEYRWLHEPPLAGQENAIFLGVRDIPTTDTALGRLTLITPLDGTVITGDLVPVSVHVERPAGSTEVIHWHIYVDDQMVLMPNIEQPTVALQGIANGPHTLKLTLSGADHRDVGEPVITQITVQGASGSGEVRASEPTPTPAPGTYADIDIRGMQIEVVFAEERLTLALHRVAAASPGQFIAPFTPGARGDYRVRLAGDVAGSPVNTEVTLERVREPTFAQRLNILFSGRLVRIAGMLIVALLVVFIGMRFGRPRAAAGAR